MPLGLLYRVIVTSLPLLPIAPTIARVALDLLPPDMECRGRLSTKRLSGRGLYPVTNPKAGRATIGFGSRHLVRLARMLVSYVEVYE